VSFCGLIKAISTKLCVLCVRIKINNRSFEPFCVRIVMTSLAPSFKPEIDQSAASHASPTARNSAFITHKKGCL